MEMTKHIGDLIESFIQGDKAEFPSTVEIDDMPVVIMVGRGIREQLNIEAIRGVNTFYKQGKIGEEVFTTFWDIPIVTVNKAEKDFIEVR